MIIRKNKFFNNPLGISVTKNQIVVTDWQNERLLSYDHDFNFYGLLGMNLMMLIK